MNTNLIQMSKFFKWWYTDSDGNEYMSLIHCAQSDFLVVALIVLMCAIIVFQYGDIALKHFRNAAKYQATRLSKYFVGLTKVFILCLVAGYGYRILSVWINPYKLLILILAILNFYTYQFRKSSRGLDVFHRINELETKFSEKKKEIESLGKNIKAKFIDLFGSADLIQHIEYTELAPVPYNQKFDADGKEELINIKDREFEVGYHFISEGVPNGCYKKKLTHDSDKYMSCVEGSFYDEFTDRTYKKGDYLFVKKGDWHFLRYGSEGTKIRTLLLPPKK